LPICQEAHRIHGMSGFLLVHGAFCGGWVWADVAGRLEKTGRRVQVVEQLPSAGTSPNSLGDLNADVNCVRQALDTMDEPVVLVGHSYGGMVITELADHPKVRHSVYLTALWPQQGGQSALNLLGNVLPDSIIRRHDGTLGITDDFELAWEKFCNDLDRDRTRRMLSRFLPQSFSSYEAPSTVPDRTHPATFMIATKESDASVAAQEASAANADYVVRLTAAHMVQLSRPDELTDALGRI
jgi:pimeloyl-ACP methyl ester carboxylesterase